MKTKILLFIFCTFLFAYLNSAENSTRKIIVSNYCKFTIWPGILGSGLKTEDTGFELKSGYSRTITVPQYWDSARIWARTGCAWTNNRSWKSSRFMCESGDCSTARNDFKIPCAGSTGLAPSTFAEFNLGPVDTYGISNIDGYNVAISVKPINEFKLLNNFTRDAVLNCGSPKCNLTISKCPAELKINIKGREYCTSLCAAVYNGAQREKFPFLKEIYEDNEKRTLVCCQCWIDKIPNQCGNSTCCLAGNFGCPTYGADCCGCFNNDSLHCCSPFIDLPAQHGGFCNISKWPLVQSGYYQDQQYNEVFKTDCPDSHSWQFDETNNYNCQNADYEVIFCHNEDKPQITENALSSSQGVQSSEDVIYSTTSPDADLETKTDNGQQRIGYLLILLSVMLLNLL